MNVDELKKAKSLSDYYYYYYYYPMGSEIAINHSCYFSYF